MAVYFVVPLSVLILHPRRQHPTSPFLCVSMVFSPAHALTHCLFRTLPFHNVYSSSLSSALVAAQTLPHPSFHPHPLCYPLGFYSYGCLPSSPRLCPPSDCLLVGMQAWTPIVRSCLSALSFSISVSLSLFLFPAPCVHSFYKKEQEKKHSTTSEKKRAEEGVCVEWINGWKNEQERDM